MRKGIHVEKINCYHFTCQWDDKFEKKCVALFFSVFYIFHFDFSICNQIIVDFEYMYDEMKKVPISWIFAKLYEYDDSCFYSTTALNHVWVKKVNLVMYKSLFLSSTIAVPVSFHHHNSTGNWTIVNTRKSLASALIYIPSIALWI